MISWRMFRPDDRIASLTPHMRAVAVSSINRVVMTDLITTVADSVQVSDDDPHVYPRIHPSSVVRSDLCHTLLFMLS